MKRVSALVDYHSSDEDSPGSNTTSTQLEAKPPVKKLRKLPSLPTHLLPQIHVDNPALHQGRRRTMPHVEGQFAAYVYIPLFISRSSKLFQLIGRMICAAKSLVPSLYAIGISEAETLEEVPSDDTLELHISLTRPTYLRAHQRDDLKRAVQALTRTQRKFNGSLVTVSELTNDERTRTFVTLEVGAGHVELKALTDALGPTLRGLRQKGFYENPRFHASFAWALLDNMHAAVDSLPSRLAAGNSNLARSSTSDTSSAQTPSPEIQTTTAFSDTLAVPTIPCLPPTLVPHLRMEFHPELIKPGVGMFEVEEVHVRIGKEISRWKLAI